MAISQQRRGLEEIVALLDTGHVDAALDRARQLLTQLDRDTLLTTSEAASLLGIRSVNTLKMLIKKEGLRTVMRGNRTMIPLYEIERIQESESVRGIRASDRAHDEARELGSEDGLTDREMAVLEDSRPIKLPWRSR
jgi:hypothetical protein